jgi:hypothetical protein
MVVELPGVLVALLPLLPSARAGEGSQATLSENLRLDLPRGPAWPPQLTGLDHALANFSSSVTRSADRTRASQR